MNEPDARPEPVLVTPDSVSTASGVESADASSFVNVLKEILTGSWSFIQLRGERLSDTLHAGRLPADEDIDLLGTEDSVFLLIQAAHEWCLQGRVHFKVERRRHRKLRLILFSVDVRQQLILDLWIEISQLPQLRSRAVGESPDGKRLAAAGVLTFEHCRPLIGRPAASGYAILRLPVAVEFCLYVCHLSVKRKDLTSSSVLSRLSQYHHQLLQSGAETLAHTAADLQQSRRLDPSVILTCGLYVYERVSVGLEGGSRPPVRQESLRQWLLYHWMQPPRFITFAFVTGCDGAGKTTLCQQMQRLSKDRIRVMTGKHLYRKSLFYKLLVVFIRPLLFQDRERFDETMAPLAYLLASMRLGLRSLRISIGGTRDLAVLVDRALLDFLIVGRKRGQARLSAGAWLRNICGLRYPVVHLHVPEQTMLERKQEMNVEAQRVWNELVFGTLIKSGPVIYIGLSNSADVQAAGEALQRILDRRCKETNKHIK